MGESLTPQQQKMIWARWPIAQAETLSGVPQKSHELLVAYPAHPYCSIAAKKTARSLSAGFNSRSPGRSFALISLPTNSLSLLGRVIGGTGGSFRPWLRVCCITELHLIPVGRLSCSTRHLLVPGELPKLQYCLVGAVRHGCTPSWGEKGHPRAPLAAATSAGLVRTNSRADSPNQAPPCEV